MTRQVLDHDSAWKLSAGEPLRLDPVSHRKLFARADALGIQFSDPADVPTLEDAHDLPDAQRGRYVDAYRAAEATANVGSCSQQMDRQQMVQRIPHSDALLRLDYYAERMGRMIAVLFLVSLAIGAVVVFIRWLP